MTKPIDMFWAIVGELDDAELEVIAHEVFNGLQDNDRLTKGRLQTCLRIEAVSQNDIRRTAKNLPWPRPAVEEVMLREKEIDDVDL